MLISEHLPMVSFLRVGKECVIELCVINLAFSVSHSVNFICVQFTSIYVSVIIPILFCAAFNSVCAL